MTKGIEIIRARFVGKGANNKHYDFMSDIEDLEPGDFAVVHSLFGPAMVKVIAVGVTSDYTEDALKWVIARVPQKKVTKAVMRYEAGHDAFQNRVQYEKREKAIRDLTDEIGRVSSQREHHQVRANQLMNALGELHNRRAYLMEEMGS